MRDRSKFFEKNDFSTDCSSVYREQFEEIPAFAKNPETGEILNDKPYPILKKIDDFNIQEYIDSFADEGDIYSLIAKYSSSGIDTSLKENQVMDTTGIPTEPSDVLRFVQSSQKLADDNPDIVENLYNDDKLNEIINLKIKEVLEKAQTKADVKEEVKAGE